MTRVGEPIDIRISKSANVNSLNQGESADVTYTINVTNIGEQTATTLLVMDTLPVEATFISADEDCELNGVVVTCTGENLGPDDDATFTIEVQVTAQAANIINQVLGILEDGSGGMSEGQATNTITVNTNGGGGGCSLAIASNAPTGNSAVNILLLLMPALVIGLARFRKYKTAK